jgi:small subunit ribosomal protein S17
MTMADEEEIVETAPAEASDEASADASAPSEAPAEAVTDDAAEAAGDSEQEAAETTAAGDEAGRVDAPAEPTPVLSPKDRRAATRAAKAAQVPTRVQTSPEDRQAERDELRTKKAGARRTRRASERAAYKATEHERKPTPAREHVAGLKKTRQGIVVSDKADKTITVRLDVARRHRKYQKIVRTSNTVHAHDERNDAHIGDTVVVLESRPLSRLKRWRLVEVVERAR